MVVGRPAIPDDLAELGTLTQDSAANIIKLPNISASNPQMLAAIKELQDHGYALPEYPEEPQNEAEQDIKGRYDRVKGSAVNPVLREGNSDRRSTRAVKDYAKKNPHSMGTWSADSRSHVAHMSDGDFYASEVSATMSQDDVLSIVLHSGDRTETLAADIAVSTGEVVDAAFMSKEALCQFYDEQIAARSKAFCSPAFESNNDESVGPHHFRPRGESLLPGCLQQTRRCLCRAGRRRQQRRGGCLR